MFSKACKYAINAMIYISTLPKGNDRVGLKEISQAINSPEAFTAKILQLLVRENLLSSIKGPNGGLRCMRNQVISNSTESFTSLTVIIYSPDVH